VSARLLDRTTRLIVAVLCLLMVTMQAGFEPRHACPIHDAMPSSVTAPVAADHHDHSPAGDSESAEHSCNCLGTCVTAGPAVAAVSTNNLHFQAFERTAAAVRVQRTARLTPRPHLLPFANAPPLS
jgi:hypothetical protein